MKNVYLKKTDHQFFRTTNTNGIVVTFGWGSNGSIH